MLIITAKYKLLYTVKGIFIQQLTTTNIQTKENNSEEIKILKIFIANQT